ncbi:MAG: hypothetical protein EAZ70_04630 [Runella slithyformis]|nr:MAG: hypothetical protein EAY79_04990 [Runella slithyformis]TAE99724.1 MAG: hypothetical protein EAZ80_04560 [Runella slithyformis]TAF28640.1 MAG: hypothetical protein EAZ70_04630 [Runella slithyformis]TAF46647.1 MAG: hypothetical protein EAZ63_09185 [Runella slithyformis]TAF82356.1 MAG: hypothetical protein EAZ50_04130 [Runella slithyformis]
MNYRPISQKWLLWLLFAIFIAACRQDQEEVKPLPRNFSEIMMGGKSWNEKRASGAQSGVWTVMNGFCGIDSSYAAAKQYRNFLSFAFYRYIITKDNTRYYFESLSFTAIPLRVGNYELTGTTINACRPDTIPGAAFRTSEHDAGKDSYRVLQSEKNYFRVTKVDKQTGLVEGEFMASFIKIFGAKDSTYPDTVRFQPSRFSAFLGAEE